MKRTIVTVLFLALVAAACGGSASDTTSPTPTTTTAAPTTEAPVGGDPDRVALLVEDEGGFVPLEFMLNRPPTFVLLADGTLIFQGPQPGAFPGPVMPGMQQVKLTADQMANVQVLVEASGLTTNPDVVDNEAANFVADATTTVATHTDEDGNTYRFSVYALGLTPEGVSDEILNLGLLVTTLADFAFAGAAGEPYSTDRVIVHTLEGGTFGGEFNDVRPWAFAFDPSDGPIQANERPCRVLEGSDADDVKSILSDATQATQWEHETGTFSVLARELLPGEGGCVA